MLQHPRDAAALGEALGPALAGYGATAVLSPALGGIVIGHEVARARWRARDLRRAAGQSADAAAWLHVEPEDTVIVVEDVVTTGLSTREDGIEVARAAGATVVAAAAIVDRSGDSAELGVPFRALLRINLPASIRRCARSALRACRW